MYKIFLSIIISILVLMTFYVCATRPKMHEGFFVYNSDFQTSAPKEDTNTEPENMPTQSNEENVSKKESAVFYAPGAVVENTGVISSGGSIQGQSSSSSAFKTSGNVNPVQQKNNVTASAKPASGYNPVQQKNNVTASAKPASGYNSVQQKNNVTSTATKTTQTQPVKQKANVTANTGKTSSTTPAKTTSDTKSQQNTVTSKPADKTVTPVVTETKATQNNNVSSTPAIDPDEDTVLWNKWRSDLQNKIMRDVKLPVIQEGIVFKFSFDVDKYGKISNIKTWSADEMYTPYAIQYIAPVIRSYQGKDILNFPQGSKRFTTNVQGAWKISKNVKYSSPKDFNDTEKVTR